MKILQGQPSLPTGRQVRPPNLGVHRGTPVEIKDKV
jgi:hypothetical protein